MLILAIIGYVAYSNVNSNLLIVYIGLNAISSLIFLTIGAGFLITGDDAMELI